MELQNVFILNNTDVLFEHFDDEIVAINLKSGYYYSINKQGIPIWKMLTDKISPRQIIDIYSGVFPDVSSASEQIISGFIADLISEGLVINSGKKNENSRISEDQVNKIRMGDHVSGNPPVLEKYTDQKELLLLDPIHEVSDLGWPEKREKGPEND